MKSDLTAGLARALGTAVLLAGVATAGLAATADDAAAAKAKFWQDYKAKRYSDVFTDAHALVQYGLYDLQARMALVKSCVAVCNPEMTKAQARKTIAFAKSSGQPVPPFLIEVANTGSYAGAAPAGQASGGAPSSPPTITGKLTNDAARQAVAGFFGGGRFARLDVQGVQEFPQENSARADLYMVNFTYEAPKNDAVTAYAFGPGGGQRTYTGKASAIFAHYNDGRWVLSKVTTPMGDFVAN